MAAQSGLNGFDVANSRYLAGFHAVAARLRQPTHGVQAIYIAAARHDRRVRELVELAQSLGVEVRAVDDERLATLTGSEVHQGVAAEVGSERCAKPSKRFSMR